MRVLAEFHDEPFRCDMLTNPMLTNRFAARAPMRARPHPAPPRAGAGLSSCAMPARRHDREST
ncbi:hypothetical protein Y023_2485 [Burkholderia pseudomallei A79D]|nr:hypothetical protein DO66_6033 [Burkholderia pseudomallei]KGC71006.1 hypothetical protein DP56_5869 [Burkholderia pseudomallei]KGW98842.1 hypothetical protein Y034_5707 [Burkholderia pseudomallei MSHR449]KGY02273.1 hypothetical protein Y023_2485 [Burkholderia pseudomallei A79D]